MGRDQLYTKSSNDELSKMLPGQSQTPTDVRWNLGAPDVRVIVGNENNVAADVLDEEQDSKSKLNENQKLKDVESNNSLSTSSSTSNYYDDLSPDFSHRPSWCDAKLALQQIKNKKAKGNRPALIVRSWLQLGLFKLGCFIQTHYAKILFVGILVLFLFCFGLQQARIETNIDKLWVEKGGRLDEERKFVNQLSSGGGGGGHDEGAGASGGPTNTAQYLVLIQTPRTKSSDDILTIDDLLLHVQVVENISKMAVELYGEKWTLPDICFKPEPPTIEGEMAGVFQSLVDKIIPCIMITPLDCFWEGSKVMGPFPPVSIPKSVPLVVPSLSEEVSWKMLDPMAVINDLLEFPILKDLQMIKSLFIRAGVDQGYMRRPCIDVLDPDCPVSAPNYVDICPIVEKFLVWNRERGNLFELRTSSPISARFRSTTVPPTPPAFDDETTMFDENNSTGMPRNKSVKMLDIFNVYDDDDPYNDDEPLSDCEQYKDDVRRLLRADKSLMATFLPDEANRRTFGKEMTGGCAGFAQKFMQWPEDLIIGGVHREANRIVRAEALQTVLMITSTADVYQRVKFGEKKHLNRYDWTMEAADNVLTSWQRNFTSFVYDYANNSENDEGRLRHLHPLAGTSINDMMAEFSKFNPTVIVVGYAFMILYASISLCSCAEGGVRSSVGLAVAGCFLVTLAGVAGLGASMILQIPFNAATTQIVPFLTLGLGVDDMFLLIHSYKAIVKYAAHDEIGHLLKETGLSALLTSVNNIFAFLAGSIVPVPALRDFCIQVAILLLFNAVAILTLFPAMITVDLIRRKSRRVDVFCCFKISGGGVSDKVRPKLRTSSSTPPSPTSLYDDLRTSSANSSTNFVKSSSKQKIFRDFDDEPPAPTKRSAERRRGACDCHECVRRQCRFQHWTLHRFVKDLYARALRKVPIKVSVLLFHLVMFAVGIIGCARVNSGLELTDVLPKGTAPYAFLQAREAYFSFYPFNAVLKGPLDVSRNQVLIRQYRDALARVPYVVKNDGQLAEQFWLQLMAEWLTNLQSKFDHDWESKLINRNGVAPNQTATSEAILAYKLLCNKGDEVQRLRVGNTRLIDKDGIINPEGFYNYLTAWYNLDPMTYYVSQANIYPTPPSWSNEDKLDTDYDIKIPPSKPPSYSQIPFFLNNLIDTPAIVDMIKKVRSICDEFRVKGLDTFPDGIPFTFWEQYLHLRKNLIVAVLIIVAAVFAVVTLLLMSPWTALIVVVVLIMLVIELAGFMGIVGLKLNAVSAVTLITAVGMGVEFTVHVSLSYLTTLGTRDERMTRTLEHMFVPVLHGGLSTLLGVIMLAFSEFEFVVRYFFMVMTALILLGLLNGLMLLPVLLSLIGPKSEVRTIDDSHFLRPPTPPPPRKEKRTSPVENVRRAGAESRYPYRRQSDSLSTIAEEQESPPSSATPPIVHVAPVHVVVHTGNGSRRGTDSPVTVTAKAKVNVKVQLGGSSDRRSSSGKERIVSTKSKSSETYVSGGESRCREKLPATSAEAASLVESSSTELGDDNAAVVVTSVSEKV